MKLKYSYFYLIVFMLLLSCSKDEVVNLGPEDMDNTEPDEVVNVEPCDFTLNNLSPNTKLTINCTLDLKGETINLPEGIELNYDKGNITNGTLNFSTNGKIDGELLNSGLDIQGEVMLIKEVFNFSPKKWEITEGEISDEIALQNKNTIQDVVNLTKKMGATTFKIDKLDVYFYVGSREIGATVRGPGYSDARNALTIPGDFNFMMSDNTHIRVQPNFHKQYALVAVTDGASNIVVSGGNLYGDRDTHDYDTVDSTHEWGHVFMIAGATNVTLKNIIMKNGSGDGLDIRSNVTSQHEGHVSPYNVLVQNCTFDSNRRNNVSITDGHNITIDNNLFLNAGVDTQKSKGTAPRYGLDVEEVYFEDAFDITISNNTERGSANGSFLVAIGYDVTIEGNTAETPMGYGKGTGIIIRNNTLNANTENQVNGTGIFCGRNDVVDNFNNKVYGNTINNYSTGIYLEGKELEINDNIINNCKTGIRSRGITKSIIAKNKIESSLSDSNGITGGKWLDEVEITENTVNVNRKSFALTDLNTESDHSAYTFEVNNNNFRSNGTPSFSNVTGAFFSGNTVFSGIEVFSSKDLTMNSNTINSSNEHGIYIRKENFNIHLKQNTITVPSNFNCIEIQAETNPSEVHITDNDCTN